MMLGMHGKPTIACRIAEWGNPGLLGGNRREAMSDGLWRTREPHGSQRKKASTLECIRAGTGCKSNGHRVRES